MMKVLYRYFPTLHTRLRDMIFGRTRIKVVRAETDVPQGPRPAFIIGCFRSGTTILRYLLDSHSALCCPPESKFLSPFSEIWRDPVSRRGLESMGFDNDFIRQEMRIFAEKFFVTYMAAKEKKRWIDKTPEYVFCLDFLDWLYGEEADYIFMFRNGLDTTASMYEQKITVLEPDKTLDSTFAYWKRSIETMLEWRPKLRGRLHEVRYEELCQAPVAVMDGVFDFLGVGKENVLDRWFRENHDLGYEDNKARRQTSIRMSHGNFNTWPPETIATFKKNASALHRAMGYDPECLLPQGVI